MKNNKAIFVSIKILFSRHRLESFGWKFAYKNY